MDQDQFQELQMVDAAWFRLLGEVCHGSDPEVLASMAEKMEELRVSTGLPPLENHGGSFLGSLPRGSAVARQ